MESNAPERLIPLHSRLREKWVKIHVLLWVSLQLEARKVQGDCLETAVFSVNYEAGLKAVNEKNNTSLKVENSFLMRNMRGSQPGTSKRIAKLH